MKLAADGAVVVDNYSKSSVDSIHAIGDVTNRLNLTPVATAEGMALAKTLFGGTPTPVDHENVPTAVFAHPNLGTVGLSEEKARERYGKVDIYKTAFRVAQAQHGQERGKDLHEAGGGRRQPARASARTCSAPTPAKSSRASPSR